MPLLESPVAPPSRHNTPLEAAWAAAVGVAVLAALAVGGQLNVGWAMAAGAAVALAGALLTRRAIQRRAAESPAPSPMPAAAPTGRAPPPLTDALEALADPLMVISAQEPDDLIARRVAYANAAARELLRIQSEGALLVTVVRQPEVLETVETSLFGGVVAEAAYESSGPRPRSWRAWSAPLPTDDAGAMKHAVLVLHDETDARRNQRMSADFLANASHELRTPLASLAGFVETLRGHAKDDPIARERFLAIMAAQADRMARLIDDLLSLSRIELNEHVPPSGDADLPGIVRDVADALTPQARARNVTIAFNGPSAAKVAGERDQIVQVVQNLLDNAIKYTPPGGEVAVDVLAGRSLDEAAAQARPGASRLSLLTPERSERRYVSLRVGDQGPGIAREHLPRLTERFYRVEGQKSGERQGTGLGLAIVKHVVNRHRGGLVVESAPGQGAAFTAYFPEASRAAPPAPVEQRELEPLLSPPPVRAVA